ncbi:MAG TPA: gamma-glutamyl-gamma-aminobutyrate hydrolase family protein [Anaeromyxobacteraceae bacterium]|nr:gamma-glutamyl-gamma-aminobutyrate hydrolase family protein [Anaeromyxobacteraceae bacterium]
MRRPAIGLTLDIDESGREYRLGCAYADAVLSAGGLPVPIAHGHHASDAYLALCHGIVITGGHFDIAPERYGEPRRAGCGQEKPGRTALEWDICEGALASGIPLLGVCGGMQLMNVVRGGTLYQDLEGDLGARGHEQPPPRDVPAHLAQIEPGSILARLVGCEPLPVNSSHHQAVRVAGTGVCVCARASDGVIEGIELPEHPFAVGVQWHPERLVEREPRHQGLWRGLIEAAQERRR